MSYHVAVPDRCPCGNGCHTGHGPDRTPTHGEGQARICPRCIDRLDTCLRQIPDTYALLPDVVEHGTVSTNPEMATTKRPDAPAPLRLEVLDLLDTRRGWQYDPDTGKPLPGSENRRGVLGTILGWSTRLREERHLPAVDAPTVVGECRLLGAHLAWISEQEWVVDFHAELKPLVRELLDRVGEYRQKPVGMCVALVRRPGLASDVLCGGALYLDKDRRGVHCVACGDHHDGADPRLRRLGRTVGLISDTEDMEAS